MVELQQQDMKHKGLQQLTLLGSCTYVSPEDAKPGDLIFFSYEETDGYLDISHVGIYVGNGKMVDARGTAYGVVYRDVPTSGMVMVGRPN